MPLDLRGFINEPQQFAGLYHAADMLEKRRLRQDQMNAQQQQRRAAAGTFLQNYLDPKDYLSGTAYDPMVLQGLQEAMQQGSTLAAQGADAPTLMMALGPMVNKLSTYSANAKNINKQVDEQIKLMKETKQVGYDYSKLRQEALNRAFYKTDPKTGQRVLDPDQADASVDWVAKTIEDAPELVTTDEAFDDYATKAKMIKRLDDITTFSSMGRLTRSKANLISQNYLVPDVDERGATSGFVPKHDIATEQGQPLFHTFTDAKGQQTRAPVRLLDESLYDEGLKPAMHDRIRGLVKEHLKEYSDKTGKQININSPQAKLVGRAIAYDLLNVESRKSGSIEQVDVQGKPSSQEITFKWQNTPEYEAMVERLAGARARGRESAGGANLNTVETLGEIMNGNPDYLQGQKINKDGKEVIDITSVIPGGGLKSGRGVDYDYKGIYFDPRSRSLIVDKEVADRFGMKSTVSETIPESEFGQFVRKIAESNNVDYSTVRDLLNKMGYKNGKFTKAKDNSAQMEFEKRSWRNALMNPFGPSLGPTLNQ